MNYAIIVAGGKGTRMGSELPKQFLLLEGRPILMHTISRFHHYDKNINIIVVLPKEQQAYWKEECNRCHFDIPHTVVDGGATRFHSSKNGLSAIPSDEHGVVCIHDGVRPFVTNAVIDRCMKAAKTEKAVIPAMPLTDSIRHVGEEGRSTHVERNEYRLVQTPQTFDIDTIKEAFKQPYKETFTDDASVVENIGIEVKMVEGNKENIKLTTPFDMILAQLLAKQANN